MQEEVVNLLRCPVSKSPLRLQPLSYMDKVLSGVQRKLVKNAILFSESDWVYPVIDGIPRLTVEAFIDYADFMKDNLEDYEARKLRLLQTHQHLINYVTKKNKHTKRSFSKEWSMFDYSEDKTWQQDDDEMMKTFLVETDEQPSNLKNKLVLDAGCGHGLLAQMVANAGATVVAMDLSASIVRAYQENKQLNAFFMQGDVQFPPMKREAFDLVYCSGVLMFTDNTEQSFSCLGECVKAGGKVSVWLYHPQNSVVDKCMNFIRSITSRLPVRIQFYLYKLTIFPLSYIIKRIKGNKQNSREMMVEIFDALSHRNRRAHRHGEVKEWFNKRNYSGVQITTTNQFGFNIIGIKS